MGQDSSRPGYQISQRADFFETEVGLETTIRRPIINTRDEPHATADKYRRLHVIIGDANLSQASNYLKFGTTAMVLSLIEAGLAPQLEVHEPVAALQAVSHDTSLTATLRLLDGRRVTALDLQWIYHEAAAKLAQDTGVADAVDGDGHTHAGAGTLGRDADASWAATGRPPRPPWSGWRSSPCWRATGTATAWTGTTPGWAWWTCSGRTSGPKRGSTTGCWPGTGCSGSSTTPTIAAGGDRTAVGHAGVLPRTLRQPLRQPTWSAPAGTR